MALGAPAQHSNRLHLLHPGGVRGDRGHGHSLGRVELSYIPIKMSTWCIQDALRAFALNISMAEFKSAQHEHVEPRHST